MPTSDQAIRRRMMTLWLIFGALLLGQFAAMFIFFVLLPSPPMRQQPNRALIVGLLAGMLLTNVPAGYFVRRLVFRTGRMPTGVAFDRYATGNLIFWATCEGVTFGCIILGYLFGHRIPELIFAGIAIALQFFTQPRMDDVAL